MPPEIWGKDDDMGYDESLVLWRPLHLHYNISWDLFFVFAGLELKGLIDSPFFRLYEDVLQLYGRLA